MAPPTGTVTFWDGPTLLGTIPLRNGKAKLTTTGLPLGPSDIDAIYSGNQSFSSSTSQVSTETVGSEQTRTKATSSRKVSKLGQLVEFTATVSPARKGGRVPAGTVSFWDGRSLLGTLESSGGKARFSTTLLSEGTHTIRVVYFGQAGFAASFTSFRQTVKESKPSTPKTAMALLANFSDRNP